MLHQVTSIFSITSILQCFTNFCLQLFYNVAKQIAAALQCFYGLFSAAVLQCFTNFRLQLIYNILQTLVRSSFVMFYKLWFAPNVYELSLAAVQRCAGGPAGRQEEKEGAGG